jgi:hypothetical protein
MTETDVSTRQGWEPVPDLVSVFEEAELLGVSGSGSPFGTALGLLVRSAEGGITFRSRCKYYIADRPRGALAAMW